MREILFRGKRVDNGEWADGSLIIETNPFDKDMVMTHIYDNFYNEFIVGPRTIGQYTGLTDKNGTKIFEGDILKNALDNSISVVEWSEAHTGFTLKTRGTIYGFPKIGHEVYKIIGNIYDSPELLEGDKT